MLFNDTKSLFGKVINNDFAEQIEVSPNNFVVRGDEGKPQESYFHDYSKKELEYRVSILKGKFMITKDKLSPIDWKLIQGTKKVGAFVCQGATCTFKGRQYTAWFTPKIPIQAGPNKFWGLPGMILSIESSDKLYSWEFVSINYDVVGKGINPPQKQPKDIEGNLSTYYKTRSKKAQDLKDKANAEGGSMEIEFMELD